MGHKTICVSNVSRLCVCAEEANEQQRVEGSVSPQLFRSVSFEMVPVTHTRCSTESEPIGGLSGSTYLVEIVNICPGVKAGSLTSKW